MASACFFCLQFIVDVLYCIRPLCKEGFRMTKPFSGKSHVGTRYEKRPNGDIYVYERITAYDQKTKKTRTIEEHLQGKIKAGTQEIVPTRRKRPKGEAAVSTIRLHTGTTDILEWAGRESGIDHDIRSSFSEGEAAKILSIARYWVATDGNTLPRLESWQNMHNLPYSHGISEDVYSALFKSVGCNEDGIQRYFTHRAAMLDKNPVIALDSTTISTYSENQLEARQGFNKDRDGLPTIKQLTLYSVKDREPIAFTKQPGNIPDVISVENAISQMKCLGIEKPLIVTDAGYRSEDNLAAYARKNMKFLTIADAGSIWIRDIIDGVADELKSLSAICPFDNTIRGAGATFMHTFTHKRARTRGGIAAGETEEFSRRLYVGIFHSPERGLQREFEFTKTILELKRQVESGQTEFTQAAEQKIEAYLIKSHMGRGGKLNVSFNDAAIQKAMKYFGYFALVSNQALQPFVALEYYRLREKIEELFADQKGAFDSRKPRVWYPDNLRGRQFVQFVGLGYHCFIMKKIKEIHDLLGNDPELKTQAQLKLENKLKKWIENHSFAQIMDWFDCTETTSIVTETVKVRWSTETIQQDKLFLEMLGVRKKSCTY